MGAAGYVHSEGDANWWRPSPSVTYGAFFRPLMLTNPFGDTASVSFDAETLLVECRTDYAGNLTQFVHDRRILAPVEEVSPNLNRIQIASDELG